MVFNDPRRRYADDEPEAEPSSQAARPTGESSKHHAQKCSNREIIANLEREESQVADGICAKCNRIDTTSTLPLYHHSPQAMDIAVRNGCGLCAFFQDTTRDSGREAERVVQLVDKDRLSYKGVDYEIFPKRVKQAHAQTLKSPPFYREIECEAGGEANLALIREWLRDCDTTHPKCRRRADFTLPTRVIDVESLRLRESRHVTNEPCITLSYVWGQQTSWTTTTDATLTTHERTGIDLVNLPKTVSDAVEVTRKLRIRYLWVDALYIIQGNLDDWSHECSRMGDYYQNAFVTISALDSRDASQGFLNERPSVEAQVPGQPDLYLRRRSFRHKVFPNAALCKRGWTLQERLLSTRVLHFARYELFWECQTCSAREGKTGEDRLVTDPGSLLIYEGDDFKRVLFNMASDLLSPKQSVFDLWYRIVRQFSRRQLTNASDRLPALSGLASLISTKAGVSFKAGIWQEDIYSLLWCLESERDRVNHVVAEGPTQYLGPSWSWVTANGSVHYPITDQDPVDSVEQAKILYASVTPLGRDPFGEVSYATLDLSALTTPIRARRFNRTRSQSCFEIQISRRNEAELGVGCFDDPENDAKELCCTAALIGRRTRGSYFLMIEKSVGGGELWRRVGMGRISNDAAFVGSKRETIQLV